MTDVEKAKVEAVRILVMDEDFTQEQAEEMVENYKESWDKGPEDVAELLVLRWENGEI